ncbi:MAG TPA: hypothetical protein DEP51_04520 [Clostridiales bacterium]|nr:hypothetical protein [Clostridiales bacterium]
MENKKIVSSGKMSQLLIGYWLLWGLLCGFIYSIMFSLITDSMESLVLKAIIAVIAQGITAIILWKLSTSTSFKKRTILNNDVPTVMRNLVIFTIVICIISAIYNIVAVNSSIDKAINSDYRISINERMISAFYNEKQMDEYNRNKEKAISDAKEKANMYLIILEIGLTVVYLAVLPLEKKELLKYVS